MKNLLSYISSLILLGSILISCSEQQGPTANTDGTVDPLNKVTVDEYTFDADLTSEPPYLDCVTGAPMNNIGTVKVYIRELTTPSGNVSINGWVDYDAYGGVILKNETTLEEWTLTNGHNPFHEVIKENGFYKINYQWTELYKLNNQTLHIHLKGHFQILPGGIVTHDRESYNCF